MSIGKCVRPCPCDCGSCYRRGEFMELARGIALALAAGCVIVWTMIALGLIPGIAP